MVNQQNGRVWVSLSATEEWIATRCQNPQSATVWALSQQLGNPPPFCPIWSQIKLPAVRCRHFGGLSATLGQSALQRQTMDPATGFCTLSWLQVHTILDSEENPLLHKQGRLASKEPRFEPLGLLYLVCLGE